MKTLTTLLTKAKQIRQTDPKNALKIFKNVLSDSVRKNYPEYSVQARFNLAITYLILGNYFDSLNNFFKCLSELDPESDKKLKAEVLRGIGTNYFRLYDYKEALKYYYLSEQSSIESSNYQNLHSIYQDFGSLYNRLKLSNKALEYCLLSLDIAEQLNMNEPMQISLMSIGACYYQLGNEDKALQYLNKSLEISLDTFAEVNALHFISLAKFNSGKLEEAENIAAKIVSLCRINNYYDFEALSLRLLGDIDYKKGEYLFAIKKYEQAIDILNRSGEKQIKFTLLKRMIDIYEAMHKYEEVCRLYKKLYGEQTEHLEKNIQLKIEQLDIDNETRKIKKEFQNEKAANLILSKALQDVSKLNHELHVLHDEKNSLMGIVAHDLKNPIQSILSSAKLINGNKNEPAFVDEMIDNIKDQSKRMVNLLNILMDYRAIEEGNIKLNVTAFSTKDITMKLLKNTGVSAINKEIKIIDLSEQNDIQLNTDFTIFYQILENLMTNAIKFSPCRKNIYIKFVRSFDNVKFSISDEGPGFTAKDKERLYLNFTKLSAKPTGNESSTGLGLSIVKKLCNILEAEIKLESEENKGAEFTITFKEKNC